MIKRSTTIWQEFTAICLGLCMMMMLPVAAHSKEAASLYEGELSSLFISLADAEDETDAQIIITKIWQLWSSDTTDAKNLELMRRGIAFMETNNYSIAEKVFSRIIERDPTYMEAWNKRATVRYILSDLQGSADDIAEVLKREPRHFGALAGLGMIKIQAGEYADALSIYKDIQIIHPLNPDANRLVPELTLMLMGDPV